MQSISTCPNCGTKAKLKLYDFSAQAWAALLAWGEVGEQTIGEAICLDCYEELRDVLIDRSDDIEQVAAATTPRTDSVPAASTDRVA